MAISNMGVGGAAAAALLVQAINRNDTCHTGSPLPCKPLPGVGRPQVVAAA
ncbi:hypothetical protein [Cupriavidus numazuensis]|uniref:hypothetical protein n=1 Tax=Cupriavidus numazuensis TaxID=221992 RepID=UPI001BA9BB89|nr:hypothetical protein [Cupriavidus numazuensis]